MQDGGFGIGGKIRVAPTPLPAKVPTVKVKPRIYYEDAGSTLRALTIPRIQLEAKVQAQTLQAQKRTVDVLRRSLEARNRALRLRIDGIYDGIDERIDGAASAAPKAAPAKRAATAVTTVSAAPRAAFRIVPAVSQTVSAGPRWDVVAPRAFAAGRPSETAVAGEPNTAIAANAGRRSVLSAVGSGTFGLPGLRLAAVSGDLASYFGAGSERGLLVLAVTDRWPGIHNGDVILSVDGTPVRGEDGSTSISFREGRSNVVVLRAGKRVRVNVIR
jgi:hypothetical protein